MSEASYLLRLADRLMRGLSTLDEERRLRHQRFLRAHQMADGGFRGREGDSDLYYTGFAVRGLAILGGLDAAECERVAAYLSSLRPATLNAVDLVSWLYSAMVVQATIGFDLTAEMEAGWIDQIAGRLETLRRADGGYAKSPEGAAGSTYQSFLTVLALELLGREVPRPQALLQFLFDRQRDDGGFVEIGPMKNSGTNPTAAAAALLQKFGRLDDETREDVRAFLKQVKSDEGGFQANRRIAFADGLSTFTGLLTCQDLGIGDVLPPDSVRAYMQEWLEFPTGGFRGASWDETADVEYTFYGLGTLGLIAASA